LVCCTNKNLATLLGWFHSIEFLCFTLTHETKTKQNKTKNRRVMLSSLVSVTSVTDVMVFKCFRRKVRFLNYCCSDRKKFHSIGLEEKRQLYRRKLVKNAKKVSQFLKYNFSSLHSCT
jgi:hypothetical protein